MGTSPDLKKTMDLVRHFCFSHGLLGEKTRSPDEVAVQFADGSVLGKPDRSASASATSTCSWRRRGNCELPSHSGRARPVHRWTLSWFLFAAGMTAKGKGKQARVEAIQQNLLKFLLKHGRWAELNHGPEVLRVREDSAFLIMFHVKNSVPIEFRKRFGLGPLHHGLYGTRRMGKGLAKLLNLSWDSVGATPTITTFGRRLGGGVPALTAPHQIFRAEQR